MMWILRPRCRSRSLAGLLRARPRQDTGGYLHPLRKPSCSTFRERLRKWDYQWPEHSLAEVAHLKWTRVVGTRQAGSGRVGR